MRNWMLAAGAAALAITAPAIAQQGGGKDKGAKAERGGGQSQASRGGNGKQQKADRGQGGGNRGLAGAQREDRRAANAARADDRGDRGRGRDDAVRAAKGPKQDVVRVRDRGRDDDRRLVRVRDIDDDDFVGRWDGRGFARGFVNGCPPGLDKKDNGCLPPGQAKKIGTLLPAALRSSVLSGPYRAWYRDDERFLYRMGPDGFIYRVNRTNSLIDALIPGSLNDFGYYPVGMAYPSAYNFYNVPMQYSSYWPDSDDYYYRYGNGAIYQVDPRTSMIQGIVALLAGDLAVGQRLPLGYSTYNVPFAYRDQYYDTSDAWYRYNDGYVYRVDPTTQLITAVIRALV
jgi:hypothetical protein